MGATHSPSLSQPTPRNPGAGQLLQLLEKLAGAGRVEGIRKVLKNS